MRTLRLAWRLQPWELVFAALVSIGLAGVALWLAADMRAQLVGCGTAAAAPACAVTYPFQTSHGTGVQLVQMGMALAPYAVGMVLGVPLVSRELEHGTAQLVWPLAGSRLGWLAWRVVPVVTVGLVLVTAAALGAEQLAQAYLPKSELGAVAYGARGVPMVARAALMLVVAMTLGAFLGRLLPALLVSIGLAVAISVGLGTAMNYWLPARELSVLESPLSGPGAATTGMMYRMPDGSAVGDQEAEILIGRAWEDASPDEPDPATLAALPHEVFLGIPARDFGNVALRETAVIGVLTALCGAVAIRVVQRRRPV